MDEKYDNETSVFDRILEKNAVFFCHFVKNV